MLGFGDGAGLIAAGPTTLTFVSSSGLRADATNAFTMLSDVQAGDLCFVFGRCVHTGAFSSPTGFTDLKTFYSAENGPMWLGYRRILAGDASATFNNQAGGSFYVTNLAAFRPNSPIGSLVIPPFAQSDPTSGDPADVVFTPGGVPTVAIGCYHSDSPIDPRGFSPTKDGEIHATGADNVYLAWKIFNSSPAQVTISMDDEGALNSLIGGYVQVL